MFLDKQSKKHRKEYIETLQAVGSVSRLFSDNEVPYLYYRSAENIFCKALKAENLSRGDITFDALKDGVGIALKTFQHRNGKCVEKIAEFNDAIEEYQGRKDQEIVEIISRLRNERIDLAIRTTDAQKMIYHLVTRKKGNFEIHEEKLEYIDSKEVKIDKKKTTGKTIWFTDGKHDYKFSKSKSTLYKKFITNSPIEKFEVDILDNPYKLLLNTDDYSIGLLNTEYDDEGTETVVLPLYSARSKKVEERSGLNQWNADDGKRKRKENEVYIPIPAWIHKKFEGFFPYDSNTGDKEPFKLTLPNGKVINAKICQGGGKGFMSNPNKDLGKWLLRHVLQIPPGEVVTNKHLKKAGIDSVVVTKVGEFDYRIDFAETGTYEEFEENHK
ncbi:phospholipase D-like domain-containing protein [Lysinibacillus capsici]|uniref:restriction endonuclease n=1 Tax=Lysinibacillus capsici TaxID=2115968 RepID=UPI0036AF07CF